MSDLIKAFQIFVKYADPEYPTCCDHDVMYISPDIRFDDVTQEDRSELEKLGFIYDEDGGHFKSFRYGSN